MKKEKIEQDFLDVLSSYLCQTPMPVLSQEEIPALMCLALKHNLIGVFYTVLCKSFSLEKRFKTAAIAQTTAQVRKTFRFFELYGAALAANLRPICVKGITVRRLWKEPDLRSSSDEDLIVQKSDFEPFKSVMLREGFELESENETQMRFCDTCSPLVIEVQSKPFCEEGELGKKLDELFAGFEKKVCQIEFEKNKVYTLEESFNLLYLICHAFKHFIRSGIGIRPLCDILIFAKLFDAKINYDFVFSSLEKISADVFARRIFSVGVLALGFEKKDFSFDFSADESDCKSFCSDIIAAGVFGTADKQRLRSGQLTFDEVSKKRSQVSLLERVFPKKEVIFSRYENARKHESLYLFYCFARLFSFLGEKNSSASGVLKEAKQRKDLLKDLEITTPKGSFLSCDAQTVAALKREFELKKSARLAVTGSSMTPFLIGGRDEAILEKPNREPKIGDIVFYQRKSGRFVLHRIAKIKEYNFWAVGDAERKIEGPIDKKNIIAVCTGVVRDGKTLTDKSGLWRFFEKIWIRLVPMRKSMLGAYSAFKKRAGNEENKSIGVEKSD